MEDQENISRNEEILPQRNPGDAGGGERKEFGGGNRGDEINPGKLDENKEIDLDRSGVGTEKGEGTQRLQAGEAKGASPSGAGQQSGVNEVKRTGKGMQESKDQGRSYQQQAQQQGKGTVTGAGEKVPRGGEASKNQVNDTGMKQGKGKTGKHPDAGELQRESQQQQKQKGSGVKSYESNTPDIDEETLKYGRKGSQQKPGSNRGGQSRGQRGQSQDNSRRA